MPRSILRRILPAALLALGLAPLGTPWKAALAEDRAGQFDYYLAAFSWSPGFCADARPDHEQCSPARDLNWILHGLWPQYETGYPRDCASDQRDASRAQTAAMADIMGTDGLAWHEWKAHGRCSGLSAKDYFAKSRSAFNAFDLPVFAGATPRDRLAPAGLRARILEANTGLDPEDFTVTCDADGWLREVRICLTRDLAPRACGADVLARACQKGMQLRGD